MILFYHKSADKETVSPQSVCFHYILVAQQFILYTSHCFMARFLRRHAHMSVFGHTHHTLKREGLVIVTIRQVSSNLAIFQAAGL